MARMVQCAKLGRLLPGLEKPPFPGELGQRIYEQVSEEAWRQWPAVQAQTAWTYTPAPSFSFQARLAYRSLADWSGLAPGVEGQDVRVGPSWVVDLSAQKWIWEQRVRGNLTVRNLNNGRDRSYIRGEAARLSLILHVSVYLNE